MTTDYNMTFVCVRVCVCVYIYMVTELLQLTNTNYPYNLNLYQIYSYFMSCRYKSTPAILSPVQLPTEASFPSRQYISTVMLSTA